MDMKILETLGIVDDVNWEEMDYMKVATLVFTCFTFLLSVKLCMMGGV